MLWLGSLPWVRALLGRSGATLFPDLPGDPPVPETLGFLTLVGLCFWALTACLLVLRRWWHARRNVATSRVPVTLCTLAMASCLVVIALAALTIRERNFGRWADLKRELIAFDAKVRAYEVVHGTVDTELESGRLYAAIGDARTFSFSPTGPKVRIVYRWWARPPRVMIIWGHGGSAGFDLDTMFCPVSD